MKFSWLWSNDGSNFGQPRQVTNLRGAVDAKAHVEVPWNPRLMRKQRGNLCLPVADPRKFRRLPTLFPILMVAVLTVLCLALILYGCWSGQALEPSAVLSQWPLWYSRVALELADSWRPGLVWLPGSKIAIDGTQHISHYFKYGSIANLSVLVISPQQCLLRRVMGLVHRSIPGL